MVKKVKQAAAAPTPVVTKEEAPVEKKTSGKAQKAQKEETKKPVVAEPVVEKMEIDSDGDADDIEHEAHEGDSITIKQKKENAKKMLSAVKKFNAKHNVLSRGERINVNDLDILEHIASALNNWHL